MRRALSQTHALRARWPLALLLAGIGLTAVAAFDAQRADRSNRGAATQVLREYASFAAWSYAQHLEETMRGMAREVIGAVNHGSALHTGLRVPDARDLVHYLPWGDACYCHHATQGPNPETFFAFEMGEDWLESTINTHPDPDAGWEVDRPMMLPVPAAAFTGYPAGDQETILHAIKRLARGYPDREHGFTYLVVPLSSGPRVLAYTLMPTVRGDTMVYGVQYRPAAIERVLGTIMDDSDLLPGSFSAGRRNRDLINVAVSLPGGGPVFVSDTPTVSPLGARADLSPRFASLSVQAVIRPDQAGALLVGGLPRSHLPFTLGLFALAAALTIVAVAQLRREADLARVRAEWIASVSHELRTPLAQIRLYLDTVRLGRADSTERRDWALGQVDRETTRLSHLVEKVLSFSRFGRGTGPLPQPIDVADEARRIVDEFRPLASARNVAIETWIEPVPTIPLRRDSLRHILLNLLDNAVKYGPDGQTVSVQVSRANGDVELAVSDQGRGVPAGQRESVWRPFARGENGADQGGSGIGLTIVRDVATQHGGRAWVDDAPGGGARFHVALPIASGTAASPPGGLVGSAERGG